MKFLLSIQYLHMNNINKKNSRQKQLYTVVQRNFNQENNIVKSQHKSKRGYTDPEQIIKSKSSLRQLKDQKSQRRFHEKKKSFCEFVNQIQTSQNYIKRRYKSMRASLIISYDNKVSPIHFKPKYQRKFNEIRSQNLVERQFVSKPTIQPKSRLNLNYRQNSKAIKEWVDQFKSSLRIKYAKKPLLPKQMRIRTQTYEHRQYGFDCRPWTRRQREQHQETNLHNI